MTVTEVNVLGVACERAPAELMRGVWEKVPTDNPASGHQYLVWHNGRARITGVDGVAADLRSARINDPSDPFTYSVSLIRPGQTETVPVRLLYWVVDSSVFVWVAPKDGCGNYYDLFPLLWDRSR